MCRGIPLIRETEKETHTRVFRQTAYILWLFCAAAVIVAVNACGGVNLFFDAMKEGQTLGVLAWWVVFLVGCRVFIRGNVSINAIMTLALSSFILSAILSAMVLSGEIKLFGLGPYFWLAVTVHFFVDVFNQISKAKINPR